jgi:hypothetical protein
MLLWMSTYCMQSLEILFIALFDIKKHHICKTPLTIKKYKQVFDSVNFIKRQINFLVPSLTLT